MDNIKFIRLDISYTEQMHESEKICFKDSWSENGVKNELANERAFYIGAVDTEKGILAAYAGFWHVIDEIEIMRVAVLPEYRRKGIAKKMLLKLESEWIDYDVILARLEVRESNVGARNLYESLGYKAEFIRKNYYSDGENAVMMKKNYREDE